MSARRCTARARRRVRRDSSPPHSCSVLAPAPAGRPAHRDAQAARLELAQVRYKNGVANYLDVLDAERELYSAEQTLLSTRLLRLTNAVDLYRSLGGGLNEVRAQ